MFHSSAIDAWHIYIRVPVNLKITNASKLSTEDLFVKTSIGHAESG